MKRGLLVTADGMSSTGVSVGADGVAVGEAVFNTAMTGYQEIVTDPSYTGQLVVMTAPHIGNYGVTPDDDQGSRVHCAGMVTRSMARRHSSWRASGSLVEYLSDAGVVALSEVDTRRLTRYLRERGAMAAAIGTDMDEAELQWIVADAPDMTGQNLVDRVTTRMPYHVAPSGDRVADVVAYDFGIKTDMIRRLTHRGFAVTVVPASTSADDVLALNPDGVLLSNGPGDPEPLTGQISAVRSLLGRVPIFGVCLGHQLLGLALGASTYKLRFGHHGANHPVRNLSDGTVAVTSQNHGFAVDLWPLDGRGAPRRSGRPTANDLPHTVSTDFGEVTPTHQNLNDGTLEGLRCRDVAAFSVQFHPEAAPGPRETACLFDAFGALMGVT